MLTLLSTDYVSNSPDATEVNSASQAQTSIVSVSTGTATSTADTVTLSTAAKAAASSAASTTADPFAGLSFAQLQVIHARVNHELGAGSWATLATNDTQLPDPATPDRIASAQAATAFIHATGPNPFKSLSRDALTAIVYDESGKYTLNEREAALGQQENNDTAYLTEATSLSYATGDSRYTDSALLQLTQHHSPVEAAVSDELILLTTPTSQLVKQLNEADSEHGGPLTTDLPYPGGWTTI